MIDGTRFMHFAGTALGGALLFAAAPAAAAPVPYTPSASLPGLQINALTFPIGQINDGEKSPTKPSGYASTAAAGDILFTFAGPTDLTQFSLWNNIVVDGIGGIKTFSLEFYDANGVSMGQTAYTAVSNQSLPLQIPLSRQGVLKVKLHVATSQNRIEIREVEFEGLASRPPESFTQDCAAIKRLGYTLTTQTIQRSSNAVNRGVIVLPFSYGVGPLRAYGDTAPDRVFIDSFPLVPVRGKRVCQIDVLVAGSSGSVANNDGVSVFLPSKDGVAFKDKVGWLAAMGSSLKPSKALTDNLGPWTYDLQITGSNPTMAPALAAALATGPNFLDIFVQDDSVVNSAKVTYTIY